MTAADRLAASTPNPPAAAGDPGPASVLIVAGEASGDWAGALLARELRRRDAALRCLGVGGPRMAAAGVDLLADSRGWGAIGVYEAARKLPRVWRAVRSLRARLVDDPPTALVLIDCGAVNLGLAHLARNRGIPLLYYFPPGSWSRRPRSLELREVADVVATPFPWSATLLSGGRARVHWVGHPVVEAARPAISPEDACAKYGVNPARPTVAFAPGSRDQELHYLLPVLAGAAARLAARFPGLQVLVPVAEGRDPARVAGRLASPGVTVIPLRGMEYDALQLAQAAAVCSGTATLEFACLGIPMAVIYRASRVTTLQYRLFRGLLGRQRFAAMPNIIADREIVRELLGSRAQPQTIADEIADLLSDRARAARLRSDLRAMAAALGPPGASARTADLVLDLLRRRRGP